MLEVILMAIVAIFLLCTIGEKDFRNKTIYLTGLAITLTLLTALNIFG